MRRLLVFAFLASGCSNVSLPEGSVAQSITQAARHNAVPRDLMAAIAVAEGGLLLPRTRLVRLDDDVPVGGVLELRHGKLDSLGRGAALMGTDELALRTDTDLATEAGARVLAELGANSGARPDDLNSWRDAVEELSGLGETVARDNHLVEVYAILRTGGVFPARDGEQVTIPAHPEVRIPLVPLREAASGTPQFPGAMWFDTSCTNKCTVGRPDGNASVNTIVIHDTEGGWTASVATLQYDGGKSVHYIVDADGSRVGQFRSESDTTYHAGNFEYNKHSVGIEHVGVAADPNGFQTKLYEKSRDLVKSIRTRWTVPLDRKHIIGHYQIPNGNQIAEGSAACAAPLDDCETSPNYGGASRHTDPGYNWQWCQYMELLGGSCTCNDAYDHFNCSTDKTMAVRCHDGKVEIDHCTAGCTVKPIGQDDVCAHAPAPGTGDDGGPTTGGGGTTIPGGGGDNGAVGSGGGTAGGEPEGATPAGGCSMTGQASSAPLVWIVLAGIWTRSRRREG